MSNIYLWRQALNLINVQDPPLILSSHLPVAVLGLLWHSCEWRLQAAQVVIELASVTQHKQVLILVFLANATATEKKIGDITARQRHPSLLLLSRILECAVFHGQNGAQLYFSLHLF